MRARLFVIALAAFASLTIFGSTSASAQGTPLFAVLLGGNECNGASPPLCRQGDLNGYGAATIILVPGATPKVCFGIVVDNLPAVNFAHIHTGQAGVNGDVFIGLSPPTSASGDPRAWSGCVTEGVTAAKINQIKANPSNFYVNVHSTAPPFTGGAVRGQLF
jgi:hypothetical protein